jgi:hypothetical protein
LKLRQTEPPRRWVSQKNPGHPASVNADPVIERLTPEPPQAALASRENQTIAKHASRNDTNSHNMAFETRMSAPPWGSGSEILDETVLPRRVEAMAGSRFADDRPSNASPRRPETPDRVVKLSSVALPALPLPPCLKLRQTEQPRRSVRGKNPGRPASVNADPVIERLTPEPPQAALASRENQTIAENAS